MQIKIISDQVRYNSDDAIAIYNHKEPDGKAYDFNESPSVEKQVNKFCKTHDVINVVPSIAIVGNNPPIPVMIYTILYNEKKKKETEKK